MSLQILCYIGVIQYPLLTSTWSKMYFRDVSSAVSKPFKATDKSNVFTGII